MIAAMMDDPIDREIVTTRVFNAPRELAFRAWTEPAHLQQWWGPKGFTNEFEQCDIRPGGLWRFVMRGPDGTQYKNESRFVEIITPERIVMDHTTSPRFRLTVTFEDVRGKTKITFRQMFETKAVCDGVRPFAVPGNEENFDKLGLLLARMQANG